jgi:hypothetical protein
LLKRFWRMISTSPGPLPGRPWSILTRLISRLVIRIVDGPVAAELKLRPFSRASAPGAGDTGDAAA